MAKKNKTESVEGAAGAEADAPKSKKKLIIMVTVIVLIGGFAAKSILLKPKPPTAAQVAAAAKLADVKLENLCASHNGLPTQPLPTGAADAKDAQPTDKGATTTTTSAAEAPAGPVDTLDAITINLAAGHYLKVGLALQVPAGMDPKAISKTENWEAIALKTAIDKLSGQTLDALSARRQVEENSIGDSVCRQTEGKVPTVYFTDFVMQ
jgi:flagellar basal body-associated protein FliL